MTETLNVTSHDATAAIADRLVAAGMAPEAAASKRRLFAQAAAALEAPEPTVAWFVPGRIEFLGKHTDYGGGRSLLCAVEQGFCMVARPRADAMIHVTAATTGDRATFPLVPPAEPRMGHWSNYLMTAAARAATNFPGGLRGVDLAFTSDLPPAAGMSSSSALVVGAFMVLSDVNDLTNHAKYKGSIKTPEDLCGYLGTIENGQTFKALMGNRGVGTFGGSEDHTAILNGIGGHLVQYGFTPVEHQRTVPLPAGHVFVVSSSGVIAEKTRAALEKYNRVSRTASVILDEWRLAGGAFGTTLAQAVRSSPDAAERLRAVLAASHVDAFPASALVARLDQFIGESEQIIPATADALAAGRLDEVGRLVDRSQAGAEAGLGNQVPETVFLAAEARRRGAVAATAFGAGFGGSVWAMVPTAAADGFAAAWSASYAERFPEAAARSRFFRTTAGPAATRVL